MDAMVRGVAGSLNLRHPAACQALLDAAARAGANVVRGVSKVAVTAGSSPTVRYARDGTSGELRPWLVVGADGRRSVTRRELGITLHRQPETSVIAGLLLDGLDGVPDDHDVLIGEGDRFFLLFHQGDGRARRTCAQVCPGNTASPAPMVRPGSWRRVRCRATRGASGSGGDTGGSVRDLSRRRHLVCRAVRGRRGIDR